MSASDVKKNLNYNTLLLISMILLIPLNLAFTGLIKAFWLKTLLGMVGCAGLPVWALLIDEKSRIQNKPTLFLLKLLGLTVLSAYPYFLVFGKDYFEAQSLFSLGLTAFVYFGAALLYDKLKNNSLRIVWIITITIIMFVLVRSDWAIALIPAFIVHIYKNRFSHLSYYIISFSLVFLGVGLFMLLTKKGTLTPAQTTEYLHMISLSGSVFSLPLIRRYNDAPVKMIKITQYLWYPALLMILYAVQLTLFIPTIPA